MTPADLVQVKPLPHRRVLGKEESERLSDGLRETWNIGSGYRFPLKEGMMPPNILAFRKVAAV